MLTNIDIMNSPKQRPLSTFIRKLWFILADKNYEEFIFWVNNGQVICVPDALAFSQTILPRLFKHNNWQSFVRQLNLYGFRKVYQLDLSEDDSLGRKNVWHFKHHDFQKNKPEQLFNIKRGVSKPDQELVQVEFARSKHKDTVQKSSTENELATIKQKLFEMDAKAQGLVQQVQFLNELQSKQRTAIKVLSKTLEHVLNDNPGLDTDGKTFAEIVEDLLKSRETDMFPSEIATTDEELDDFDNNKRTNDYLPDDIPIVIPFPDSESSLKSGLPQPQSQLKEHYKSSSTMASLPSISSLFHFRPSETLPPIKRQRTSLSE